MAHEPLDPQVKVLLDQMAAAGLAVQRDQGLLAVIAAEKRDAIGVKIRRRARDLHGRRGTSEGRHSMSHTAEVETAFRKERCTDTMCF